MIEVQQRLLWQPGTLSDHIKQKKMEIRQDLVFNDWLFLGGAALELRYSCSLQLASGDGTTLLLLRLVNLISFELGLMLSLYER